MKRKYRKQDKMELAKNLSFLKKVSPDLSNVCVRIPYQGVTFTIAKATLELGNGKKLTGEGVSRRSFIDKSNNDVGFNIAVSRALEALDKKLRRSDGFIGFMYEG